jgi:hypothetical protein
VKPAVVNPIIKKLVKFTLFKYSGSRKRYGIPRYLPKPPVIMAKRMIQHSKSTWFRLKLLSNN